MARTGQSEAEKAQQQYMENANTTFAEGQKDIGQYRGNITKLMSGRNVGADPFLNPAYLGNEARLQAGALSGENAAADTALRQSNRRTGGLNTGATQGEISGLALQKMRLADALTSGRAAQDYGRNLQWQQFLARSPLEAAQAEQAGYGTSTSGQSSALGDLTQFGLAEYGPWNALISGVAGAGGAAIGAFCPAEGTVYLMADGSDKPVEKLSIGDLLAGIDGEAQTIEEIQSGLSDIIQVITEDGYVTRNSPTHAFALPKGGFVVSVDALGKTIVTAKGTSKIISVQHAGRARVFNIITNGSHTYRADGVWALGVGPAERQVSMTAWQMIGQRLMKGHFARAEDPVVGGLAGAAKGGK